jgi:hypothetical protein
MVCGRYRRSDLNFPSAKFLAIAGLDDLPRPVSHFLRKAPCPSVCASPNTRSDASERGHRPLKGADYGPDNDVC